MGFNSGFKLLSNIRILSYPLTSYGGYAEGQMHVYVGRLRRDFDNVEWIYIRPLPDKSGLFESQINVWGKDDTVYSTNTNEEVFLYIHTFLISSLRAAEWDVSRNGCFTPGKLPHDGHWIVGFWAPRSIWMLWRTEYSL